MSVADEFRTLDRDSRCEIKVKGSRFLALAFTCITEDQFNDRLRAEKKSAFDATHHCYAFSIGLRESHLQRTQDDGEPSGTAGKPILQAIQKYDLTNVGIIVTRYFGGTKLGTGGLARAYREAADSALTSAVFRTEVLRESLLLRCGYDGIAAVLRTAEVTDSLIEQAQYGDAIIVQLGVRLSRLDAVRRQLVDATRGRAEFL